MIPINQIQDWWNTLSEDDMSKVYQGQCKHVYDVKDGLLECTKCKHEITIDAETIMFNYMHEIKDMLNEI